MEFKIKDFVIHKKTGELGFINHISTDGEISIQLPYEYDDTISHSLAMNAVIINQMVGFEKDFEKSILTPSQAI